MLFNKSLKITSCFVALSVCGLSTPQTPAVDVAPPQLVAEVEFGPAAPVVEPPAPDPTEARVAEIRRAFAGYQSGLADFEIERAARAIVAQADHHGIEVEMILAVIHTESGFSNFARSRVGALGLMQIMPATGEMLAEQLDIPWNGPETLFDPEVNIRMGTHYLKYLHTRFDAWNKALAAYNYGPGAISKRIRKGRTLPKDYYTKVLSRFQQIASR